jgi:hypothetical protein
LDLPRTLALAALLAGLAAFAGWRGARPPALHKGPRMAPWPLLMMLFAAGAIIMLVHVVNLLGVTTGR